MRLRGAMSHRSSPRWRPSLTLVATCCDSSASSLPTCGTSTCVPPSAPMRGLSPQARLRLTRLRGRRRSLAAPTASPVRLRS